MPQGFKLLTAFCFCSYSLAAQKKDPVAISPVGIVQNLSDSALLEVVQRQTFRFSWNGAHPVSALALERSNTVLAEHYWD